MTLSQWCVGGEHCMCCGALSHEVRGCPSRLPSCLGGSLSLCTQAVWLGSECCDSTVVVGLCASPEKVQSKGENSRKIKEIFLFLLTNMAVTYYLLVEITINRSKWSHCVLTP